MEKARVGIVGQIIFSLLFLALAITIAHYKGVFMGIVSGIIFSWWLYQNMFRRQLKTKADVLYEQEMEVQRNIFRPYARIITYFFLVTFIGNIGLYFITEDSEFIAILDFIAATAFLAFLHIIMKRSGRQDIVSTTMSQAGFTLTSDGDILSTHEKIRFLGPCISMGNIFSGSIGGFPARIFDYSYEWMRDASYTVTFLEVTNVRKCPNMLIISKSDTFSETIIPDKIFPGIPVQLEGNFSEHFSLFVEGGAEDEIRQFLPPDLMAVLIDRMPDLSFLFLDNKIYIVLSNNSERGFLKDYFLEQIDKARFILGKWAVTLSRMEQ